MKRPALALLAAALCVFSLSRLGNAAATLVGAKTDAERDDCWQSDPGDQAILQAFKGKGRPLFKLFAQGTMTLACKRTGHDKPPHFLVDKLTAALYCRKGESSLSGYKGFVAFSSFDIRDELTSGLRWKLGHVYWKPDVKSLPLADVFRTEGNVYSNGEPQADVLNLPHPADIEQTSQKAKQTSFIVTKLVPPPNLQDLLNPCQADTTRQIEYAGIHYVFAKAAPAAPTAPPAQPKPPTKPETGKKPTTTGPASGPQKNTPRHGTATPKHQPHETPVPPPAPRAGKSPEKTATQKPNNSPHPQTPVPPSNKPATPAPRPTHKIPALETSKTNKPAAKPATKTPKTAKVHEATVAVTPRNPVERGGVKWWPEQLFTITYQDPQTLQTGTFKQTGPNSWEHNGAGIGTASEISRRSPGDKTPRGTKFFVDKGWEYRLPPLKLGEATQISAVELHYPHRTREFKILTISGPSCPERIPIRRTQS